MNSGKIVLQFLTDLSGNNNREWMQANKPRYEEAKGLFEVMVGEVIAGCEAFDPSLAGLTPKNCTFRINRDIRFSQDKRPYKTNFGAYLAEGGKKSDKGGYYFQLQPGGSFVGGGVYMPQSDHLAAIRQEIDYNPEPLHYILNDVSFKKYYGSMQGEKLKTAPKGYASDHPDIEMLKHKSFIVTKALSDIEVMVDDFSLGIVNAFKLMKPFKDYLISAIG